MASPVQPKAVILYAKIGSVYYPVACAKDVSLTTTSDFLEIAARSSVAWREYEYGRLEGSISGSGITVINPDGNLYTVFDVFGQQFNRLKFLVKLSFNQGNSYKVFEANVLVEELNATGSASALSNYTYKFKLTGPVQISTTPVENTNPQIGVYEYTATGGESVITLPITENATVLVVYVNGVSLKVIEAPGGYGSGEVQKDGSDLNFGTSFTADDYVKVIYVDVDGAVIGGAFYLEDGTGDFIEDGTGEAITTE